MNFQQLNIMKFLLSIIFFIFLFSLHQVESKSLPEPQELKKPSIIHLEFPMEELELFYDCGDNKFISRDLICDGNIDCKSGIDEKECETENHL